MNVLQFSLPLPEPVDDLTFAQHDEIETMTVRAKGLMTQERYTFTDCFVVGYAPRNSPFGAGRPLRVLDGAKLEAKRREQFEVAYRELKRALLAKRRAA